MFVPFSPFSKHEIIICFCLSFIERTDCFGCVDMAVIWVYHQVVLCLHNQRGIKHDIPIATWQLSQSEFSWMHQNNCSSRAGRVFSMQNRLKQCFKHVWKDNWTFYHFSFSRSHLINIHEKKRDQRNKSG